MSYEKREESRNMEKALPTQEPETSKRGNTQEKRNQIRRGTGQTPKTGSVEGKTPTLTQGDTRGS